MEAAEELARRKLALQTEVAKLVAQGYKVKKESDSSAEMVPSYWKLASTARRVVLGLVLAVYTAVALPVVVLAGILIPILGWIFMGFGAVILGMVLAAAVLTPGQPKPRKVSVRPDGTIQVT